MKKYQVVGPRPVLGQQTDAIVDVSPLTDAQVAALVEGGHIVKATRKTVAASAKDDTPSKDDTSKDEPEKEDD